VRKKVLEILLQCGMKSEHNLRSGAMKNLPADFPSLPEENASLARLIAWFCEVVTWLVARAAARAAGELAGEAETAASAERLPPTPPRTGSPDAQRHEAPANSGREACRPQRAFSPSGEQDHMIADAAAPAAMTELPPRAGRTPRARRIAAPNARGSLRAPTRAPASRPQSTADRLKIETLRDRSFARPIRYDTVT
jgi:hypothetical protein